MYRQRVYRGIVTGLVVLAVFFGIPKTVLALEPVATSDNYQMVDSGFEGTAGSTGCSDSFCTQSALQSDGETPLLEVTITPGSSDLGKITVGEIAKKTATLTVKNYLSYGYTVQISGHPPKYGDHTINTPSTSTAVEAGTEMFGLNLVTNSSPSVGGDPIQEPSGGTEFGVVNSGYNEANKFKYTSGDTVAHGISTMNEVGQTTYTISMVMAISNVTPAGNYATDLSVVVVPIY